MKPLQDLTPTGQVRRLRRLAHLSLAHWGLENATIRSLVHGENTTFQVSSGSDQFMLRLARPAYHSVVDLASELAWLRLSADNGQVVPEPVAHSSGYLVSMAIPGVQRVR